MRLRDVRLLLDPPPDRLPTIPKELIPVVLAGPDGSIGRPRTPLREPRRAAAVLILLYPDTDGEALLVLTERSAGSHRHAGQISLPGGRVDATDRTPVEAALREAREEINLDPAQAGLTVAGVLPPVDVSVSGFIVDPVVAFAEREPLVAPDGYEVASIFGAPLAAFLPGAPIETITDTRDGYRLRYGAFRIRGHAVWGATAMLLARLGAYLATRRTA